MTTKGDHKKAEKTETYVYAVGRRKTAVAQVRLYAGNEGSLTVNTKEGMQYFGTDALVASAMAPLVAAGLEKTFRVTVHVMGGGKNGQADATKLGVARALVKHDLGLRPVLKARGFLTRDPRSVERKKAGLKKARRAPQWSKR